MVIDEAPRRDLLRRMIDRLTGKKTVLVGGDRPGPEWSMPRQPDVDRMRWFARYRPHTRSGVRFKRKSDAASGIRRRLQWIKSASAGRRKVRWTPPRFDALPLRSTSLRKTQDRNSAGRGEWYRPSDRRGDLKMRLEAIKIPHATHCFWHKNAIRGLPALRRIARSHYDLRPRWGVAKKVQATQFRPDFINHAHVEIGATSNMSDRDHSAIIR